MSDNHRKIAVRQEFESIFEDMQKEYIDYLNLIKGTIYLNDSLVLNKEALENREDYLKFKLSSSYSILSTGLSNRANNNIIAFDLPSHDHIVNLWDDGANSSTQNPDNTVTHSGSGLCSLSGRIDTRNLAGSQISNTKKPTEIIPMMIPVKTIENTIKKVKILKMTITSKTGVDLWNNDKEIYNFIKDVEVLNNDRPFVTVRLSTDTEQNKLYSFGGGLLSSGYHNPILPDNSLFHHIHSVNNVSKIGKNMHQKKNWVLGLIIFCIGWWVKDNQSGTRGSGDNGIFLSTKVGYPSQLNINAKDVKFSYDYKPYVFKNRTNDIKNLLNLIDKYLILPKFNKFLDSRDSEYGDLWYAVLLQEFYDRLEKATIPARDFISIEGVPGRDIPINKNYLISLYEDKGYVQDEDIQEGYCINKGDLSSKYNGEAIMEFVESKETDEIKMKWLGGMPLHSHNVSIPYNSEMSNSANNNGGQVRKFNSSSSSAAEIIKYESTNKNSRPNVESVFNKSKNTHIEYDFLPKRTNTGQCFWRRSPNTIIVT
ncbi:MAG: hypothetical protein LBH98_00455 [Chitinispirillales bacterium]|nr:hypothetical protein [Chitinispirillales bacterium]